MLKKNILLISLIILSLASCAKPKKPLIDVVNENINFAVEQYKLMDEAVKNDTFPLPRTVENGKIKTLNNTGDWTSGFYPGTLWYLYEYSKDENLKNIAIERTSVLTKEKDNIYTHDLGFMLYCSFGNGYRLTGDTAYASIMVQGAKSLTARYNDTVGCIRSWDHGTWQYPVIIDNMMNLEFLFWASKYSSDTIFKAISLKHANTTMANHFRADWSTYHVVDYNKSTGEVVKKSTHQGYADESAWARGQAWGLYGYTMMYRETKDAKYLDLSNKIAQFILTHPNLPADKIPYWDFNAPNIPNAKRDASAGAVIASALIELSGYVSDTLHQQYITVAEEIVRTLSSEAYRAQKLGDNHNFILNHSVGHYTANSEVDVPLNYADYYYVEALMRFKEILEKQ